jgi:hypothetical protein
MPRLAPVIKTVFLCDVHDDLLLGLTLAGPILPLYWVKPAGVAKLIGAWQFFFLSGFPARQ